MSKLQDLADLEGYVDIEDMLKDATFDRFDTGICTNKGCDYTTNVEPDSDSGWCEECNTNTVSSCLMLAGLI